MPPYRNPALNSEITLPSAIINSRKRPRLSFCYILEYVPSHTRRGGGTGIRAGLRILSRKGCGFDSHPRHRRDLKGMLGAFPGILREAKSNPTLGIDYLRKLGYNFIMNTVVISPKRVRKEGGVVILSLEEYKKLSLGAAPDYYLKGRAANKLDKLVGSGLKEYREGKTKVLKSLADFD